MLLRREDGPCHQDPWGPALGTPEEALAKAFLAALGEIGYIDVSASCFYDYEDGVATLRQRNGDHLNDYFFDDVDRFVAAMLEGLPPGWELKRS